MRNSYRYSTFKKDDLLRSLLNMSITTDYISVLVSNIDPNCTDLPIDYVNYDLVAGVGLSDIIISNNNSFETLNHFHSQRRDWLFGYLSYDLKNEIEDLNSVNLDGFNTDNLSFFVPEYVLLLNNNVLEIQTFHSQEVCDMFIKNLNFSDIKPPAYNINFNRRESKESYLNKVEKIKDHIQKGDIYELNFCQEFYSKGVEIIPESIFSDLNKRMQTPFSSFLKLKSKYILSASPERFLRKKSSQILSQPIKGTSRRGLTKYEDINLISELKSSDKDISENVMITDLVRNDLSIISKNKSVKVDEFCKVYTFKRIHQMISTVSSEITNSVNFTEIIKATFPMGSMTGAPKLRAMELIEFYENFKRGVFSGSVGYITPKADFDFNVVIRTILYNSESNYISIGVGGAITIKSDPIEEYNECIIKASPLFDVFNFKIDD